MYYGLANGEGRSVSIRSSRKNEFRRTRVTCFAIEDRLHDERALDSPLRDRPTSRRLFVQADEEDDVRG
jgi:hypothetical protein